MQCGNYRDFIWKKTVMSKLVEANGEVVSSFYEVKNGDEICTYDYYSVKRLLEFAGMDVETFGSFEWKRGRRISKNC